jgi:putative N-acetylmannosamine-6-phosphate epimerase
VEQKLEKEHKEELMHAYTYYMRNQSDLPDRINRIKLPRSLTMDEIEADVLAIFDACLGGAVGREGRGSTLYVFTAHRETDTETDIEFLTQKPMLVYDLKLKEFRKARVFKLWENEKWRTWPDCK